MALLLMILGALAVVAGTCLFSWKAAIIVAGVVLIAAGADLARPTPSSGP